MKKNFISEEMEKRDEIKSLKIRSDSAKKTNTSDSDTEDGGGRRTIIILFLLTILLSLLFWLQSNLSNWWTNVIGPSKWSFSK